jgi:hypothetical protein
LQKETNCLTLLKITHYAKKQNLFPTVEPDADGRSHHHIHRL